MMNLIDYTTNWIKGELFEARFILAFGFLTILAGFLFWKIGTTPNAKALLIPLIIVGGIYSTIGGGMLFSNKRRLVELPRSYQMDKEAFIQSEKMRVEGFQYQYKVSKIVATLCFILTLLIFWFSRNPTWQGIGIALSVFGLGGLVIDRFSEERAGIYYKKIVEILS